MKPPAYPACSSESPGTTAARSAPPLLNCSTSPPSAAVVALCAPVSRVVARAVGADVAALVEGPVVVAVVGADVASVVGAVVPVVSAVVGGAVVVVAGVL